MQSFCCPNILPLMIIGFLQICFPIFPSLFLLFVDGDSLKACIVKPGYCTCEVQFESFQTGDDWCEKHHSYLTFRCPAMWWFETGGLCWQEWMMQLNGLYIGVFTYDLFFDASRNSRVKSSRLSEWRNCHSQEASLTSKTCFATKFRCWVVGFWSSRHVSRGSEHFRAEVKKIGGMMIICFFVFCGFCHAFLVLDNGVPCRLTFETKVRYSSQQSLPTSLGLSHFKRNYAHNVWPSTNQSRPCPDQCRPSIALPPKFKWSLSRSSLLHNWCRFPPAMIIWRQNEKKKTTIKFHCINTQQLKPSCQAHLIFTDSATQVTGTPWVVLSLASNY